VPVPEKLPVLSTGTPETSTLVVPAVIVKSAVTPAPLNPVPATVTLVPTGPFLEVGDVMTTFCSTVYVAVAVLTPSVTEMMCAPAVAVGINTAKVIVPAASVVTVVGAVVIATPSNLAVRIVVPAKLDAVMVNDAPTAPLPVVGVTAAATALAGTAAIATRLPSIASTASNFTIFVFILI
jgi:hypothetical protein